MMQTKTDVAEISEAVREKRGWFIALGILLIVVGSAAVVSPYIATISMKIFIGWFLVISGVAQAIHAFWAKDWSGFFWQLIVGILEAAAGAFLLAYPVAGIIALTAYLAVVLIFAGFFRAICAFKLRPEAGWTWVLIGGIASVIVGVMLWAKLPSSALWAIGLLLGINIAMSGWTLLMVGLAAGNSNNKKANA